MTRLLRELNTDVSLRVEESENADSFRVSGRGELHLSVLIENMRREGYEFAVSKAEVLYKKDENGKLLEPIETAYIDVPDEFTGTVIDKLSQRKGELQNMSASNGTTTRLEFSIPARGLIGYRGEFMTDTKGNGILNTAFDGYAPYKGDIQYRKQRCSRLLLKLANLLLTDCTALKSEVLSLSGPEKRYIPEWSSDRTEKLKILNSTYVKQNI